MVLILLGAKMLLLTRAPTWHHCKSEVAITAGEYWWEKTLCSQQHIVRHAGKNKNLLFYWQRLCLHVYIKSKLKQHALFCKPSASFLLAQFTSSLHITSDVQSLLLFSRPYTVVLGVDSLSSNETTKQEFTVARSIPHPNYDGHRNDIMLLQVKRI